MPPRYYCHMCNVEINIPNADFTCPLCRGGFVEELPAVAQQAENAENAAGASTSAANGPANDRDPFNRIAALMALRGEFARMAENENGTTNTTTNNRGSGNNGPRVRQNIGPNFIIDFLNSLDGHFGNTSMVYLGNIGDYAWGREGIDTIVTQLLNQMETAGPPPLSKEKIDEIPKVNVSQEEVEKKTQCSVCWEDFELNEVVRKLPCSHIYHENCIVPWLDLHGTCPICRKSLSNEEDGEPDETSANAPNSSNSHTDGNAGSARTAGGATTDPPTMRNSALDDLD